MAADLVIAARGLRRSYGDHEAVRGVDLQVSRGEIFALLGPNGAGKTTVVEILAGLRERSAGEVRVLGADPATAGGAWRERIGVVLQESRPDPGLTVRECLDLYAGYYRAPRAPAEIIELVGLTGSAGTPAEQLSGGERRRLDVGVALVGDPELLFLDEPTTGFDPAARRAAWETIDGLRRLGTTIVLTTHAMDEAERLADRIAVLAAGAIVAAGTPETIDGRDRRAAEIRFTLPDGVAPGELPAALAARPEPGTGAVTVPTTAALADVRTLADWALRRGTDLPDLELRRPALEDVYLALIRREDS
jgi:ABC-2 type transport system ATP-binding protein